MAQVPTPRSLNQLVGSMVSAFLAKVGFVSIRPGSPTLSIFEAAAQSDLRNTQDTFALLASKSLDQATGQGLDNIGTEEDIPRLSETFSTGTVTIGDSSFSKLSSDIYRGSGGPIAGSSTVKVTDASQFPANGQVYLGRGTLNYEGPLTYSAKTNFTTYWTLTLSSPTLKYHNVGESVIVAQGGDRTVTAGTVAQTPQASTTDAVKFSTTATAVIPDGEIAVYNVPVACQKTGTVGNVASGAIKEFSSAPFSGATVANPSPFINGVGRESDEAYRDRIRAKRQSRVKGTSLAIRTDVTGITAPDENKRVLSSSLIAHTDDPCVLYIDDGTGYEETNQGIPLEGLMDSAEGGERFFSTAYRPIAKAFVKSSISAPFALIAGATLRVKVGGVRYEHTFDTDEFVSIGDATANELSVSINANPDIKFSARTSDSGATLILFGRDETGEDIEVETIPSSEDEIDANDYLGFPTTRTYTMRLYKNDVLLSKDGKIAEYTANSFSTWRVLSGTQTLVLKIDGTPSLTFSFEDDDFVELDTGFTTVGLNSMEAWATVLDARIPGITAAVKGGYLTLTSNRGASSRASIQVVSGTLVLNGMFAAGTVTGEDCDYTLDRNLGQVKLKTVLAEEDSLSAGSDYTRSFIQADPLTSGILNLSSDAKLWFSVDDGAETVASGVRATTELEVTVSSVHVWGYKLKIASTSDLFTLVERGDLAVIWDSAAPDSLREVWRVANAESDYFEIERKCMTIGHAGAAQAVAISSTNVLVAGGFGGYGFSTPTAVCERLNLTDKVWTQAASMNTPRGFHTVTVLNDGRVLVVGGIGSNGEATASCEIYDPTGDTWTAVTDLPVARYHHRAVLMASGKVFVAGGQNGSTYYDTCYIYDVGLDTWTAADTMAYPRAHHILITLADGKILTAGGQDGSTIRDSSEIYTPGTDSWANTTGNMATARRGHQACLVSGPDRVFVTGGTSNPFSNSPTCLDSTEFFDEGAGTWSSGPSMDTARSDHFQIKLSTNNVLVGFGYRDGSAYLEKWDGGSNTWATKTNPKGEFDRAFPAACVCDSSPNEKLVVAGGQLPEDDFPCSSSSEQYSVAGNSWTQHDPAPGNFTPVSVGVEFVRATNPLTQVTIDSNANHTAKSLVNSLNDGLVGASSAVYKGSKLRASTNTFATTGDIALVAADTYGQLVAFTKADAVSSTTGHIGSVESANGDLGTPTFSLPEVMGVVSSKPVVIDGELAEAPRSNIQLVTVRDVYRALNTARVGNNIGFHSTLSEVATTGTYYTLTVSSPAYSWIPEDRLYWASPLAIGPYDTFSTIVDQDIVSKRFTVNMWRAAAPASTYASTLYFSDMDGGQSFGRTFGLSFDFADFTVFMKARGKTHSSDADRRILWRYWRFGPEGNNARIKYSNPSGPSTSVSAVTDVTTNGRTNVKILLAGGSPKVGYSIRATTKLGIIAQSSGGLSNITFFLGFSVSSASRDGSNNTVLTLTLPAGATNHGLDVGDALYLKSTDSNWTSNPFTITAKTATTITFQDTIHGTGVVGPIANIGTVSFDLADATLTGASAATGDFFQVTSDTGLTSDVTDNTIRLSAVGAQYWTGAMEDYAGSYFTTVAWYSIGSTSGFKLFANPAQTATAIASAISTAAAVTNSTVPVTPTVIGTGSDTIAEASFEENAPDSPWVDLVDGVNYVRSCTPPVDPDDNYEFVLKDPVSASLTTDADWDSEEVRLCPTTVSNMVDWLNAPTVTGLFSVTSVEASSRATHLQIASQTTGSGGSIQVQSGTANAATASVSGSAIRDDSTDFAIVTVPRSSAQGFFGRMWCSIDNASVTSKQVFDSSVVVDSIDSSGNVTLGTGAVFTQTAATANVVAHIESQGNFVCIRDTIIGNSMALGAEGEWVFIRTPVTPTGGRDSVAGVNCGVFRVVRTASSPGSGNALWIENASMTAEGPVELDIRFFSSDSMMPGDTVSISTDKWNSANKGLWTVESVGGTTPFNNDTQFKLSVASKAITAVTSSTTALGTDAPLVQVLEASPARLIKQIKDITPNQNDGTYADIKFTTSRGYGLITSTAGSVVTALDKFGFPTTLKNGIDGYAISTGLIGEANRVVYGVPGDSTTYPGVAAAGSQIDISGPIVKRVTMAFVLRVRSGFSTSEVSNRAKSAAAAVINSSAVGQPIAVSDVIAAVSKVDGVVSVTISSPQYAAGKDLIKLQEYEKALVLDIDSDIQISFTGE